MRCFITLILYVTAVLAHIPEVLRPYELVIYRESATLRCTYLTLRQTQQFRSLPVDGYTRIRRLHTGEERIQHIVQQENHAWARAEMTCGDRHSWDFPTLLEISDTLSTATDQTVLTPSQSELLPIDAEPLITSGDSSNRVDLVFFADGCALNSSTQVSGSV